MECDSFKEKCFTLESELARKLEDFDALAMEHRSLQDRFDEIYLSKGADGALKVEVDQL